MNIMGTNMYDEEPEENREVLKTQNMIEDSFFANLKKTDKKMASKIGEAPERQESLPTNTEELMLNLYEIRDGLIESFETVSLNTAVASKLATHINKLGSCIKKVGGTVDEFVPLEHVSGLQAPNLFKSAEKVIETTKQCYTLGKITETRVEDEGKTIFIQFEGKEGDMNYVAKGTITASSSWKGNEAIDYIYTIGSGRMSVKAFENNKWSDNHNDYHIYWELDEIDTTADLIEAEVKDKEIKEAEKSSPNKEDIKEELVNKIDDEEMSDNDSFPIQEN